MIIRLNEAELLRAGMPRDAVVALRKIVTVIGDGISVGDEAVADIAIEVRGVRRAGNEMPARMAGVPDQRRLRSGLDSLRHVKGCPCCSVFPRDG